MKWIIKQRNRLLSFLARAIVRKYEPGIIAVTGAIGKTSTQEAIYTILRELRNVRASSPDFIPSTHGASLGILGSWKEGSGFFFWLKALGAGYAALLTAHRYPELLILEYEPEPRFIQRMLGVAEPHITVVTALLDPRHTRAHAIAPIIKAVPSNGYCIVNYDDAASLALKELTRAHVMSFGFNEGATMRITHLEYRNGESKSFGVAQGKPLGISFKLEYEGNCVPVRLDDAFGKAPAYAIAAAACVGMTFGLNLARIAKATQYYRAPRNRMQLIPGKKGIYLFDDTKGATTASLREALETLAAIPAPRAIAVIGSIRISTDNDAETYAALMRQAAKLCDLLITVGDAPIIDKKNNMRFDTPEEALAALQTRIERGDAVLIAGLNMQPIVHGLSSHRLVA